MKSFAGHKFYGSRAISIYKFMLDIASAADDG